MLGFSTGISLYELLVPQFLRRNYFFVTLPVVLGLLQLSCVEATVVAARMPIMDALRYDADFSGLLFIVAIIARRRKYAKLLESPKDFGRFITLGKFVCCAAAVIALPPILAFAAPTNTASTQTQHVDIASRFLEGGGSPDQGSPIAQQLDIIDQAAHATNASTPMRYANPSDSDYFARTFQWGVPAVVATIGTLSSDTNVDDGMFVLLVLSLIALLALTYHLLREFLYVSHRTAIVVLACIAINGNELGAYYQGAVQDVFVAPFVLLTLILYLYARRWGSGTAGADDVSRRTFVRSVLLFAAAFAGFFADDGAAVFVVAAMAYGIAVVDIVFTMTTARRGLTMALVGMTLGSLFMARFSIEWFVANFEAFVGYGTGASSPSVPTTLAAALGIVGAPIASPDSVVGTILAAAALLLSIVAAAIGAAFLVRERRLDRAFWIMPFLLLAAIDGNTWWAARLGDAAATATAALSPLIVCLCLVGAATLLQTRKRVRAVGLALALIGIATNALYAVAPSRRATAYAASPAVAMTNDGRADQHVSS